MNKPQPRITPFSLKRHERLWRLYSLLLQLVMHEGRFISERTNILLLLYNSVFFAGFLLLATQTIYFSMWVFVLKVAVSVLGIAMSAFHFIIVKYTVQAAQFWRDKLIQIENDSDFWYPAKVDTDLELNIIETRQKTRKLIAYLEPNTIYGCWLPFLLTLLWSLTLCWSTIDYLSRIN